ncbi:MAG TPA: hypothetical protein PKD61_05280 [Polyangiaceae bacterium]|nr:hypothetical protein [Polyangiaceae bacterium]
MNASSTDELFNALTKFRAEWPKRGWSWDNRLSCVASAFGVELSDEARQALPLAFPHQWNHRNLNSAPPIVQQIAERTGGVRQDQMIVATNPVAGSIAYGLWWPWGDDTTISLRIGVAGGSGIALEERLRETFGARVD